MVRDTFELYVLGKRLILEEVFIDTPKIVSKNMHISIARKRDGFGSCKIETR